MNDRTFWLVWNQNGGAPTVMHETRESALREAERLARNVPGQRFVVMQSIDGRVVDNIQRITYDDEIPF